jgi:hypothetical protein
LIAPASEFGAGSGAAGGGGGAGGSGLGSAFATGAGFGAGGSGLGSAFATGSGADRVTGLVATLRADFESASTSVASAGASGVAPTAGSLAGSRPRTAGAVSVVGLGACAAAAGVSALVSGTENCGGVGGASQLRSDAMRFRPALTGLIPFFMARP